MKLKITLEVEMENPPRDDELALLLRDALGEFKYARTPVAPYIQSRYGSNGYLFMENKSREVHKRLGWADALYSATGNIIVERS